MHKKLAADLTSLAHSILQLKNKEDVVALKEKAYEVYEKLALLAYVDEYLNTTPNATETKEELVAKIEEAEKKSPKKEIETAIVEEKNSVENDEAIIKKEADEEKETHKEEPKQTSLEEQVEVEPANELDALFLENDKKTAVANEETKTKAMSLEEELSDTISVDVAADLFEKPTEKPTEKELIETPVIKNLQIGLNDRIAFVKHLFKDDQEDFNDTITHINTLKNLKAVNKYLKKEVKSKYNWADKEEYELRFTELIERKFE